MGLALKESKTSTNNQQWIKSKGEPVMKKQSDSPIPKEDLNRFLEANPKIKDALDLFKISQEQYIKALQSKEPQITTTDKVVIEIEA